MAQKTNQLWVAVGAVLFLGFIVIGIAWKLLISPLLSDSLVDATGSQSQYDHEVTIRLDAFSGYAPLRSPAFVADLKDQGIRVEFKDDGADYNARLKALKNGQAQMAVFTIDALITSSAWLNDTPGTIVMVIDETYGADAIVAYKDAVPTLRSLNDPGAQLALTPASPSEFLGRVAVAEFGLSKLNTRWQEHDGAADVYEAMKKAPRTDKKGYVLWEPQTSMAKQDKDIHVLFDSSQVSGYIVDVLVVQRQYLLDHPDVARKVVEAAFRALYQADRNPGGLVDLVQDDAAAAGDKLSQSQAESVVQGIRWRNTLENYTHFGLVPRQSGILHLEDSIGNITGVLLRTGALTADPTAGRPADLFYADILKDMMAEDFHPSKGLGIVNGGPGTAELDEVRVADDLKALSDAEWEQLTPAGSLQIKPISFRRGKATLNVQSERELDELARRMRSLPRYYVTVRGHARAEGDPAANLALAEGRAETARAYLEQRGVDTKRIRAIAATPEGTDGDNQSVSFWLGQQPY